MGPKNLEKRRLLIFVMNSVHYLAPPKKLYAMGKFSVQKIQHSNDGICARESRHRSDWLQILDTIKGLPIYLKRYCAPKLSPRVDTFLLFGAYCYTTVISSVPRKLKRTNHAPSLSGIFTADPLHYYVMDINTKAIFKSRYKDFMAYKNHLD